MKAIKPKLVYIKQDYFITWPYLLAKKLGQEAIVSFVQGDTVIEIIDFRNPSYQDYFTLNINNNSRIYILVKYNTGSIEFLWRINSSDQIEIIFWHYEDDTTIPNNLVTKLLDEFLNEISI
jgi:hypothetical protein